MSHSNNPPSQPEGTEVPVSLRALMQQLGQVAGAQGLCPRGRFFDALRAICLTVDPSLLWQSRPGGLADFLAAISSVEDQTTDGMLDSEASLDALMAVLAVHGYLSPSARPVLSDRLRRSLASYQSAFWQQDEAPTIPTAPTTAASADAQAVLDWNALGARLMRPSSDRTDPADTLDDTGWESFPALHPNGPTLH